MIILHFYFIIIIVLFFYYFSLKFYPHKNSTLIDIIEMIKSNSTSMFLPTIPENDAPHNYINLMKNCWNLVPSLRPSTRDIIKSILKMQKQSGM